MKIKKQSGFGLGPLIIGVAIITVIIIGWYFISAKDSNQFQVETGVEVNNERAIEVATSSESSTGKELKNTIEHASSDNGAKEKEGVKKAQGEKNSIDSNKIIDVKGVVLAGEKSPLINFNQVDYEKARSSQKLIILYFYANWCPVCKNEVASALYPAFNELTTDQVIGFQVNYNDNQTDTMEKDLAREFGVAYQHTKVFLKRNQRVLKSPESWTKEKYLEEITKHLQ